MRDVVDVFYDNACALMIYSVCSGERGYLVSGVLFYEAGAILCAGTGKVP